MAGTDVVVPHREDSRSLSAVVVAPPLARQCVSELSSADFPAGNDVTSSLAMAIHKKVRCCFTILERRLRFSEPSAKDEDPSALTIEFLRARLQAQRAECKAEKQRAQQLAEKVLELEQRLKLEVDRSNKISLRVTHELDPSSDNQHAHAANLSDREFTKVMHCPTCETTICRQSLTSKMDRITCSHSFLDMKSDDSHTFEKCGAGTFASHDNIHLPICETLTVNARNVSCDGDFITEHPCGQEAQLVSPKILYK